MVREPYTTGRRKKHTPGERARLLLFAVMTRRSNRDMESMMELLFPILGFKVSYKTIERLCSNVDVGCVLHNAFVLMLKDEGVSGHLAGDGTGYSLKVKDHYSSNPEKRNSAYRYSFTLIDVETGLYVGYGYSSYSEKKAYSKALGMTREMGIPISSIRLDKYYSSKKILNELTGVKAYVIPKKTIRKIGIKWNGIIREAMADPHAFLRQYYRRNLSKTGFSADKNRFGRKLRQRREDRRAMTLLHNVFVTRVAS